MYPPYSYDAVVERRNELLRLAEEARRAQKLARRDHRARQPKPEWRSAIGTRLVRAGRRIGGEDAVNAVLKHC